LPVIFGVIIFSIFPIKEEPMRYARLVFMFLAVAVALLAADPFVGTWIMNPAKSKFKTGAPPKEQTVTVAESGGDLDIAVKGTAADGTPISIHYTIPSGGGSGKVIEASSYDAISGKRENANERETTYSKDGKALYTTHAKLAKNGKVLTVHSKGTNPAGQMVDGSITYDRH
jgi:hypothetical protein